ncbi:MAG: hydantoinase B/oxoprolinase family protein [Thermoleophilia bacterium]
MATAERRAELAPILFEIVEGALESARREMELQVDRTARSTIVREQHDHRAGIFDATGQSVTALSFASTPTPIIKKFTGNINEGDVFVYNDCYKSDGGITHLPDICITVPIFHAGDVIGYVQVFGNVNDIGGDTPGSVPLAAFEIFQEGLMIPPVKLFDRGVRNDPLYETILNNSRFPDDLKGDVDAFINACSIGVARVQEIVDRYGRDVVEQTFEALLERCARDLRSVVLPMIPDGTYEFEDFCEYDGVQPREPRKFIRLKAAMTKSQDEIVFDFTGTDDQVVGSLNWPGSESYYAKFMGTLFKGFAPDMVINDGVNRVIRCVVPPGTVLSPKFPAACSWRTYPLLRIIDVGLGCLGKAFGGFVPASAETISSYGLHGFDAEGQFFLLREITGAGSGGRPFADGCDTVDAAPEAKNMPGEFAETFFPVRVERLGLRKGSGGAGKHRGGLGYWKEIRFLVEGTAILHSDRATLQPWGVAGGKAGAGTEWILNPGTPGERRLPGKTDYIPVVPGDVLRVLSPGGGGWGDPLDRDPEAVRIDVVRDLLDREAAAADYGVVLDDALQVDEAATTRLRDEQRASRGPLRLFDRGDRFYELISEGQITLTTEDGTVPGASA